MQGYIADAYWQYQNNVYDYQLVKNMNSYLKKSSSRISIIKGSKDMVMGYANNSFVELM